MIERAIRYTALFFFVSLFTQVGKHLWPPFSSVSGIRIDYLSPTIHLSDILISILFFLVVVRFFQTRKFNLKFLVYFLPVLSLFILQLFIIDSFSLQLFGILKFFELVFVGFFVRSFINNKTLSPFLSAITIGAVFSSILAIAQFFHQGSFQGPLYFLGERAFNVSTIGIALMQLQGQIFVRAYALFPHPNVLAYALVFTSLYIFAMAQFLKNKWILYGGFFIIQIGLFLTFSRVIIILYLIALAVLLFRLFSRKSFFIFSAIGLTVIALYAITFQDRFVDLILTSRDFDLRLESVRIAFKILEQNWLLGTGLNNFYSYQLPYYKIFSPIFLQPVHNIFLLTFLQVGILGFILVVTFLIQTLIQVLKLQKIKSSKLSYHYYTATSTLLLITLLLGLSDHFLLTLQQGQLLFAVLIGLAWVKLDKNE